MRKLFSGILMLFLAGCASANPVSQSVQGVMLSSPVTPAAQVATLAPTPVPSKEGEPAMLPSPILPEVALPARFPALPDLGPAPELTNEVWINTDQPLRLADLGGKVVLVDMWTFG